MSAGKYNMRLEKGSIFHREIRWVGNDGKPVDLTGYLASMMVRDMEGDLCMYWSEENGGIRNWRSADPGRLTVCQYASINSLIPEAWEGANKYDLELRQFFIAAIANSLTALRPTVTGLPQPPVIGGVWMRAGTGTHRHFRLEITAAGPPATYRWSIDGTFVASQVIEASLKKYLQLGDPPVYSEGVHVTWPVTTPYTLGDYWDFDATGFQFVGADSTMSDVGKVHAYCDPVQDIFYTKFRPHSGITDVVGTSMGADTLVEGCKIAWPTSTHIHVKCVAGDPTNPNTFVWSIDGGTTWMNATGTVLSPPYVGAPAMTTAAQVLSIGGVEYIRIAWVAVTGHTTNDECHFDAKQKLCLISSATSANTNGMYAVWFAGRTGVDMWFSRQFDGGDITFEQTAQFNSLTVGGLFALRLLEGTFTILGEQTRNVYPL